MRTSTKTVKEFWTVAGTTPGYWTVWAKREGRKVQLGTVTKIGERNWEFIAFGIWFASGKNLVGTRATLSEAAQSVADGTMTDEAFYQAVETAQKQQPKFSYPYAR